VKSVRNMYKPSVEKPERMVETKAQIGDYVARDGKETFMTV